MGFSYLVDHPSWDAPRRLDRGPNTNAEAIHEGFVQTFGRSPACAWTLDDPSLPDVVAILVWIRYRRNYLLELMPEDYGSLDFEDFKKTPSFKVGDQRPFTVAKYKFLKRVPPPPPPPPTAETLRLWALEPRFEWNQHDLYEPNEPNEPDETEGDQPS